MIFFTFVVLFFPIIIYEGLKVYKKYKEKKDTPQEEYYDKKELIPYYNLNDSSGFRIEDGQEVFVLSRSTAQDRFSKKGIYLTYLTYCTAIYVPPDLDTEEYFNLKYLVGHPVVRHDYQQIVLVVDRSWKKEVAQEIKGNGYSSIDEIPFSHG